MLIAGAGGAAHLPGMTASKTTLPVLGVPMGTKALRDRLAPLDRADARRDPVGTLAIGRAGAVNAALLAAAILARSDEALAARLRAYREDQAEKILAEPDPSACVGARPRPRPTS